MNTHPPILRQILVGVGLLGVVTIVAFIGSQATIPNTEGWYARVNKVPWNPPNSVFAPAWTVLYVFIAVTGWLIWRSGWRSGKPNAAKRTLSLFGAQLAVNAIWTPIFFAGYPAIGKPAWWAALVVILALIVLVAALVVTSSTWSKPGAALMLPYLTWLVFAASLNVGIIVLN